MCVQNKKSNPQSFNLKYKLETSCSWLLAVDRPEKKESLCKEVSREELGEGVAAQSGDGEDAEGDPVPGKALYFSVITQLGDQLPST